ncbi:MAG TPA: hypothetical protein VJ973_09150, partial [Christiangramia sp.]|nr:hypothetical protein [Christiangramia sp.]
MKGNYFLYLLVCFFFWNAGYSQDSKTVSKDTLYAINKKIGEAIDSYEFNQAIESSYELLNLAKEASDLSLISKAYSNLGYIY